jgi:hypothetical protein
MRFRSLVAALNDLPGMQTFGVNERALFEDIMMAWAAQQPLTVRQAISIARLGSPATLHKRVLRLRKMGYVDAVSFERDRRTKYLVPTAQGLEYAQSIGRALVQSLQPSEDAPLPSGG